MRENIISVTANDAEVGETWDASLYDPEKKEYVHVILKIVRVATQEEYRAFCRKVGFPIRDGILPKARYYEIQILD